MKRPVMLCFCSLVIFFAGINCSFADTITTSGAFYGWDADPVSAVSISNDGTVATLNIQAFDDDVTWISLYHYITLPPNVSSISFDVKFNIGTSRAVDGVGQPNFLQVAFVPETYDLDPIYFRGYDKEGVYIINDDQTTTPTTSNVTSDGWYHFTQDITSLAGLSGYIEFDLFDRGDTTLDYAQVRNVNITENQTNPVPEPSTMLLFGIGFVAVQLFRFRKMQANG